MLPSPFEHAESESEGRIKFGALEKILGPNLEIDPFSKAKLPISINGSKSGKNLTERSETL